MSRVTPGAPLHRLLAVEDGGGVEQGRGGHRHGGDPDSRHQHRRGLHSSRVTCHVSGMVDTCHLDGEVRGAGPRDGEVSLEGDGGHGEDRRHDGEVSHEGGGAAEQRPEHPVPGIICQQKWDVYLEKSLMMVGFLRTFSNQTTCCQFWLCR